MAFAELKARQSVVWGNGPYERITNTIRDIHELVDRANRSEARRARARRGDRHRRGRDHRRQRGAPTSSDRISLPFLSTPRASERPRRVSASSSRSATRRTMRYDDASFDVVTSTCGVMFAPDHEAVARRARARYEARWPPRARVLDARAWTGSDLRDDGAVPPHRRAKARAVPSPGATRTTCANCSTRRSSSSSRSMTRRRSPSRPVRRTGSCSPRPTGRPRRLSRHSTTERREEFHRTWVDFFAAVRRGRLRRAPRASICSRSARVAESATSRQRQ